MKHFNNYRILLLVLAFVWLTDPALSQDPTESTMQSYATQTGVTTKASSPIPKGRRLREIAADKFIYGRVFIGGASHGKLFGTPSIAILNREFNYITPANDFKQSHIHPEPGKWRWQLPDQWVDSAKLHNQQIRMHSPISPQASKWAKDDARTPAELETNLTEYMTELCKHYNGKPEIGWMDVVNETVSRDGTWFGPKKGVDKWENPWTIVGSDQTADNLNPPSYIRMAFEIANEHAPDIKLIYNQHGDMEEPMWTKVKNTVLYLKSLGLRVDGIGWQAHLETDFLDDPENIARLEALIDWAHANDLEFLVTENDVDIKTGHDEQKQAEVFSKVVETVIAKGINGVVSWNAWMMREGDGQGSAKRPTMFFDDGSAKPAYYAVQQVLENIAHQARLTTSVSGSGQISIEDQTFLRNSEITLTATPDDGFYFSHWTGGISGSENPVSFILNEDKQVSGVFSPILSIENDTDPKPTFDIYPNPISTAIFNIRVNNTFSEPFRIEIFHISGELVSGMTYSNQQELRFEIDSSWKTGLYLAVLTQRDKKSYNKFILH